MLLSLPVLVGCQAVATAEQSYGEFFGVIEGPPTFARGLSKAPLSEVVVGPSGWSQYEIGRRFETGSGGLPADPICAYIFYDEAARSPYQEIHTTNAAHPGVTVTRHGVPSARVALRRLKSSAFASEPERWSRRDKCRDTVKAAAERQARP